MLHRLEGEDPWLELLWIAMPKLPLVQSAGMWQDYLPVSIVTKGIRRLWYQFASSFYPPLASAKYIGQWQSQDTLLGLVSIPYVNKKIQSSVSFGNNGELLAIDMGNSSLRRFS